MGILTEHSLYLQESFEFFAERIVTVQKNPAWNSITNWTSTGRGGHREGIGQPGIEERRRHFFSFCRMVRNFLLLLFVYNAVKIINGVIFTGTT